MLDFNVYEHNDGTVCIYAYEGEGLVWAAAHRDPAEAARDMAALAGGADPSDWEGDGLDEGEEDAREMIASSFWHRGHDEDFFAFRRLGNAGRAMILAFCGRGVEEV